MQAIPVCHQIQGATNVNAYVALPSANSCFLQFGAAYKPTNLSDLTGDLSLRVYVDSGVVDSTTHTSITPSADLSFTHAKTLKIESIEVGQYRDTVPGDICPQCHTRHGSSSHSAQHSGLIGRLEGRNGIEVGHTFLLGRKYSSVLGAKYLGRDGAEHIMEMGCFGIGVTRIMSSLIEVHADKYVLSCVELE